MLRVVSILLLAELALPGCGAEAERPVPSPESVNERIAAAAAFRDVVTPVPTLPFVAPEVVEAVAPPRRRPRPPPPIRLRRSLGTAPPIDGSSPCVALVDRVCDLLTIASEECGQARERLSRGAMGVDDGKCAAAIDFVRDRIDVNPKVKPCVLLQDLRCAGERSRSPVCKKRRKEVAVLTKMMPEACIAEILIEKGFAVGKPPTSAVPPRPK